MTGVRLQARETLGIHGNIFEDFLSAVLFYPCVATQLEMSTKDLNLEEKEEKVEVICQNVTS